jgi:hypothetical protein
MHEAESPTEIFFVYVSLLIRISHLRDINPAEHMILRPAIWARSEIKWHRMKPQTASRCASAVV